MPVTVLVGAQWGDEGKGRVVDWLSMNADVVARYAGGDNAGHTVAVDDTVYKMHLIPSGILHQGVTAVMGNGMVVNPINLVAEMERLTSLGVVITPENLVISARAHIITLAHIELDKAKEAARGGQAIGTTLRGIGPAYLDKTGRKGLRMGDMLDIETFAEKLKAAFEETNHFLDERELERLDVQAAIEQTVAAARHLQPFIRDAAIYLYDRLTDGANVVCEGAQGTLLDVDHGSYPYVTSSSPTVGGALTGLGIAPGYINRVVGVAKAFSTRVGSGPMPTELHGDIADRLRGTGENFWDEFGTTTGRPRRCGWLDGVLLRYASAINGFTELVLTKLDILTGFDELKVAVAYEIDGERWAMPPADSSKMERATPIYETLPGWAEDITGSRDEADLPEAAQNYVQFIGDLCEVPIQTVSVGPERDQLVHL